MHPVGTQRKTVAPQSRAAPFAALLVANVALAFGAWFVRHADTGPVAAGLWRIALAAPVLAGLAVASGSRPTPLGGRLWWLLGLGGVAFAADLGCWHLGIRRTTLANATLFGNCATLIFPVYGFVAARTLPTRLQAIALGCAAVGAALLMGRSYQLDPRHLAGDLLCILAGLLYTIYFVLMARVRQTLAPVSALALSTVASVLPLLGFALALGEAIVPHLWWPLVSLALVSQVLGQGCMVYALGRLSPLVIGVALLVQPVVAAAIGWASYGERLGLADWIGAALVAAALVMIRGQEVAPDAPARHPEPA
ncbi:DMT family transporter [Sphingomonas bacterium]|uniref:DMT family transporter n=1 Tax=Sphingomonas bacterium TaxID=1895847 RepID=UPI0015776197|nr:DMT family transporter [Sphingomonas bacterium]